MTPYIGTKTVHAAPMSAREYARWRTLRSSPIRTASGPDVREGEEDQPGYLVEYKDGYCSWSPAAPFEEAYRPIAGMNFGDALAMVKAGRKVARAGWNGKGMWLELQRPDSGSRMTLPYIFMKTVDDNLVPWLASQTDMLAEDWRLA